MIFVLDLKVKIYCRVISVMKNILDIVKIDLHEVLDFKSFCTEMR